jgi:predicted XRE-type DNA-binding protein
VKITVAPFVVRVMEQHMRPGEQSSDEADLKVALAKRVNEVIVTRGMSQSEAAAKIGTTQPKVSQIRQYKLSNISVGRLLQVLVALEQRVDILIRPSEQQSSPGVRVTA